MVIFSFTNADIPNSKCCILQIQQKNLLNHINIGKIMCFTQGEK